MHGNAFSINQNIIEFRPNISSSYVKHQPTGPSQSRTEKGEVKTRQKNTDTETGHRKSEDRKEGSPAVENMSSTPKRKQIKEQGAIALYVS